MDKNSIQEVPILKYSNDQFFSKDDAVVSEIPLSIHINGNHFLDVMCFPQQIRELVTGFLLSEGLIENVSSIKGFKLMEDYQAFVFAEVDPEKIASFLAQKKIASGCGLGVSGIDVAGLEKTNDDSFELVPEHIFPLMKELTEKSIVFLRTGGVHSVALSDGKNILFFSEDIGRHNALDKVIGEAAISGIGVKGKCIITSGRISSEIVLKAARSGFNTIISRSAPTSLAVQIAEKLSLLIVGFARGRRLNVYSCFDRIKNPLNGAGNE